ncbi:uncharacterized protein MEPE_01985 [Melanopsichium pennsylvanicum]|uniref:RNA polymerase II-associated protein 3 n=2 Tax=Melanopsichium pennsylvanicum TaxID=63383 RepID=A0AAJ5C477_9BASI|nr:conserved hypothetical protein [Melanopsichium pennsylvanicum 4]SNX83278.1 uncharacterized protein MEPE_01985 [Melanopsichium pennsylvanicum]
MTRDAQSDREQAEKFKQLGNEAFRKQQWAEAIGHYSAAQLSDPNEATYPLNRAMAYLKLGKFLDAERDCTTALSMSPNNVKALYRRATASIGANELEKAVEDYEAVIRLDPKNAEAKAGLAKACQALESQKSMSSEPLDLTKLGTGLDKASEHIGSPDVASDPRFSIMSKETNNSVEAARKFLQQIGMSDAANQESDLEPKASTSALPDKFPGETGGLLREVTTRKTATKPAVQPDTAIAMTLSSSVSALAARFNEETSTAPHLQSTGAAAKKTASALNFGVSASQNTAVTPSAQVRQEIRAYSGRMTSLEFQKKWKSKSVRLQLLLSIDPDSIPRMIDAMLDPQLVGEILQTVADGYRADQQSVELLKLAEAMLVVLARCKRFGMTVCMLDDTEKGHAAYLVNITGRSDLKSIWEVA